MHVVLDTSVVVDNYRFDTPKFIGLSGYLSKTRSRLFISEVVRKELFRKYRRDLEKYAEKTMRDSRILFGSEPKIDIDTLNKTYQKDYLKLVANKKLIHYKSKKNNISTLIDRDINSLPPFDSTGKGFRDSVIWVDTLDLIKQYPKDHFCFISSNTKDFGAKTLHPNLIKDLGDSSKRVLYFNTIESFLSEYGDTISFIDKKLFEDFFKEKSSYLMSLIKIDRLSKYDIDGIKWDEINEIEDVFFNGFEVQDFYIYESTKNTYKVQVEILVELEAIVSVFESFDSWETEDRGSSTRCWVQIGLIIDRQTKEVQIDVGVTPTTSYPF